MNINRFAEGNPALVLGLGGCGCNIVRHMAEAEKNDRTGPWCDYRFVLANTDSQALKPDRGIASILLGPDTTKALGACGDPEAGRQAAEESREAITAVMQSAPVVFLVAGMGGGTGTGATPVIVDVAKTLRIPLVVIAIRPFSFEGKKRTATAIEAIAALARETLTLVVIPNERVLQEPADTALLEAFKGQADFAWKLVKASWPASARRTFRQAHS